MGFHRNEKVMVYALVVPSVAVTALWAGLSPKLPPSAGELVPTAPMKVARASHTSTLLPSGKVVIAGGFAGSGSERNPYSSLEIFDPAMGAFSLGGKLTIGRSGHSATLLKNRKILFAGGWGEFGPQRSAELYDPATGTSVATGDMSMPRGGQTATLLANGKVLLVGGERSEGHILAEAEVYDPASEAFSPTGSMSAPRVAHTATLLADGRVLITGGSYGRYPAATILASAEIYDPTTGRFSPTGAMTVVRHKHAAVLLPDGQVLVLGGSDNRDWRGTSAGAEVYNPRTARFTSTSDMHWARFKIPDAVVLLQNGKVLIAGGASRAEVYDPAARNFSPAAGALDTARYFSSATLLHDGCVLVTGGYGPGTRLEGPQSTPHAWIYRP